MPSSSTRGALTLMIGTLASRVTGLLRVSLLNQLFDPTVTDAFNIALKVPTLFRELLAEGALTNSFIPAYRALPPDEAKRLVSALFSLLLVVNALLQLVAVWAAPTVVGLLIADNSTTIDIPLTVAMTRAVFPFLAAISFAALAMGILNAEERFFAPAWAPVALNVVTTVLMLVYQDRALLLAVAFALGGVAQLLVQLPVLASAGLLPRLGVWWHPRLGGVLLLMVPFTFSTGARQVLNFVSSRLLSTLPVGSVTAYANADLFLGLALGLFSISPTLAFYSRLAALTGEPRAFRQSLLTGLRLITFLTVPAGLLLALYAGPAVESVFNWSTLLGGDGMAQGTLLLSVYALSPLGLAVFPLGLNALLMRTFYVRQHVRLPVLVSVGFTALNALLYVLLVDRFGLGVAGLSWATVVVAWAQLAALLALVWQREHFSLRALLRHSSRVWLAALLSVALGWVCVLPLPAGWWGAALTLAIGGGVSLLLYVALCARLGVSEVEGLRRR